MDGCRPANGKYNCPSSSIGGDPRTAGLAGSSDWPGEGSRIRARSRTLPLEYKIGISCILYCMHILPRRWVRRQLSSLPFLSPFPVQLSTSSIHPFLEFSPRYCPHDYGCLVREFIFPFFCSGTWAGFGSVFDPFQVQVPIRLLSRKGPIVFVRPIPPAIESTFLSRGPWWVGDFSFTICSAKPLFIEKWPKISAENPGNLPEKYLDVLSLCGDCTIIDRYYRSFVRYC